MSNRHKESPKGRAIQVCLRFLTENGFEETAAKLREESKVEEGWNSIPPNMLLDAIAVWDDQQEQSKVHPNTIESKSALERLATATDPLIETCSSTIQIHNLSVVSVCFAPDSVSEPLIASGGVDKKLIISNFEDGSKVAELPEFSSAILSIAWNPVFKHLLAVSCISGEHYIINVDRECTENTPSRSTFNDHKKYVVCVKWSSDGIQLISASHDNSLKLYRLSSFQDQDDAVDGDNLQDDHKMKQADHDSWQLHHSWDFEHQVEACAFISFTRVIVSLRDDNNLYIVNTQDSSDVEKINMNARGDAHVSFTALDLNVSPDGKFVLVSTDKHRMIVYQLTAPYLQVMNFWGMKNDGFSHPKNSWSLCGNFVYSSSQDHTINAFDLKSGKLTATFGGPLDNGHTKEVRDMMHHPSRHLLVTCSYDRSVKLWAPSATAASSP